MTTKQDMEKVVHMTTDKLDGILTDNLDTIKKVFDEGGRKGITVIAYIKLVPGAQPGMIDGSVYINKPISYLRDDAEFTYSRQGDMFQQ